MHLGRAVYSDPQGTKEGLFGLNNSAHNAHEIAGRRNGARDCRVGAAENRAIKERRAGI